MDILVAAEPLLDAALPALDRRRAGLGVLPPLGDVRFRLHRARA